MTRSDNRLMKGRRPFVFVTGDSFRPPGVNGPWNEYREPAMVSLYNVITTAPTAAAGPLGRISIGGLVGGHPGTE